MKWALGPLIAVMTMWGQAPRQAANEPPPTFEVASVKPSPPVPADMARLGSIGAKIDPSQARFTRASLTGLIARAYRVDRFQISGPDWMSSSYYDIVATIPEGVSTDFVPEMLQGLLEDRFKLSLHTATKDFDLYVLSVADGGPKIQAKPTDYKPDAQIMPESMAECTVDLSLAMGRPVLDQTGLEGPYLFPRGFGEGVMKRGLWQRLGARPDMEEELQAPSQGEIQRSLQAFGLKLDPRQQAMPVLTIDHVEKSPTEN